MLGNEQQKSESETSNIVYESMLKYQSKTKSQANLGPKSPNYGPKLLGQSPIPPMVWYGMVWYDMVWYGMVWYGMVWYGMVWYV